jgi:hypothetical protein
MKHIFLPVQCPTCRKTSIVSPTAVFAKSALSENMPISLQCPFEMTKWNASYTIRMQRSRLIDENQRLEQVSWLRFKDEMSISARS